MDRCIDYINTPFGSSHRLNSTSPQRQGSKEDKAISSANSDAFFLSFRKSTFWLLLFWSHSVECTMGKEHPPPLCICTCDISFHVPLRLKRAGRNKDTVGDGENKNKRSDSRDRNKKQRKTGSHPHLWLLVYPTALTSCPQRTANFLPLVSEEKPQSNRADVCSQIK